MDNDDRLLCEGKGMNDNHELKFRERVIDKRFLSRFNEDNTPSRRYHYTSPEGLMGILKTRTFFFTDSQFLNDFREKLILTKNWICFGVEIRRIMIKDSPV